MSQAQDRPGTLPALYSDHIWHDIAPTWYNFHSIDPSEDQPETRLHQDKQHSQASVCVFWETGVDQLTSSQAQDRPGTSAAHCSVHVVSDELLVLVMFIPHQIMF